MENVDWRHLTTGSSGLTGQARSQLNRMLGLFLFRALKLGFSQEKQNQRSCRSFLRYWLLQQKARIFLVTSQETSMARMRAQRQFTSFRGIGQNRLFLRRFQNPRLRPACCSGAPVFLVFKFDCSWSVCCGARRWYSCKKHWPNRSINRDG